MSGNVYKVLDRLGIDYEVTEHDAAYTVEEADRIYGHLEGAHTKNLFLRNKKGDQHYLVVAGSHKRVDLKALRDLVGERSLSFASPERLMTHLGLTPGSVSPFGLLNDTQCHVRVLLDEELLEAGRINFHPNINTKTITLSAADFSRFLDHCGHSPRLVPFPPDSTPDGTSS